MKKIFEMKMKEGTPMETHLNEFNGLVSKLIAQKMNIDEDMKAVLLLCTLPESWDTFRTAMSNNAPAFTGLSYIDVESSLLTEEMNRRNNQSGKASSALNARGRSQSRGRGNNGKSRSKSHSKKDMGMLLLW